MLVLSTALDIIGDELVVDENLVLALGRALRALPGHLALVCSGLFLEWRLERIVGMLVAAVLLDVPTRKIA